MRAANVTRKKKALLGVLAGVLLLCCGTGLAIGATDKPPKRDLEPLPAVSATGRSTPPAGRSVAPPALPSKAAPHRSAYYANCAAARAAGAAPLRRGDPGYRPALDRDGDGIACER